MSSSPSSKDSNRSVSVKSSISKRGTFSNQFTVENEDPNQNASKPVSKHSMQRVHFGTPAAGGYSHEREASSPPSHTAGFFHEKSAALPMMSTETIINVE